MIPAGAYSARIVAAKRAQENREPYFPKREDEEPEGCLELLAYVAFIGIVLFLCYLLVTK